MRRVRPILLVWFLLASVLVAACASAGSPAASATRVEVKLSDALQMDPAVITLKAGSPVTFVVTNAGAIDHEFVVGDQQAQDDHEKEMAAMPMTMDEPNAISVKAGTTKELTYTFKDPGTYLAGCHVAGHYLAGMKATITVQ